MRKLLALLILLVPSLASALGEGFSEASWPSLGAGGGLDTLGQISGDLCPGGGKILEDSGSAWVCIDTPVGGSYEFIVSDGTVTQTINNTNTLLFATGAALLATVSATDTVTITIDGVIDEAQSLDFVYTNTNTVTGQPITITVNQGAGIGENDALTIDVHNEGSESIQRGIVITMHNSVVNSSYHAGITIDNRENIGTMLAGIIIQGTTPNKLITAIDLSDSGINNSIALGDNPITTSTGGTILTTELDRLRGLTDDLVDLDDVPTWLGIHTFNLPPDLPLLTVGPGEYQVDSIVNVDISSAANIVGTKVLLAAEGARGTIEIADQSETDIGTNDTKAVTPLKLVNMPIVGDVTGDLDATTVVDVQTDAIAQIADLHDDIKSGDDVTVVTGTYTTAVCAEWNADGDIVAAASAAVCGSGGGDDADAIHDNVVAEILIITGKTDPVGADLFIIEDSAESFAKKSVAMSNIDHDALKNFVADEHLDWTANVDTIDPGNVGPDHVNAMSEIDAGIIRGLDGTDTHILTTAVGAPGSDTCLEMDTDGSVVLAAGACGTASGLIGTLSDVNADADATDDQVMIGDDTEYRGIQLGSLGGTNSCSGDGEALQYNQATNLFECEIGLAGGVAAVGPGCSSGACLNDGVITAGTDMFIWEGTTSDAAEFTVSVPADPGADITHVIPDVAATITFPSGTQTLATIGGTETLTAKTLTTPTIGDFTNATHDHLDNSEGGTLGVDIIGPTQIALCNIGGGGSDAQIVEWDVDGDPNCKIAIQSTITTPADTEFLIYDTNAWKNFALSVDINVTGVGVVTIQPDVVTYDKMQDVTATDRFLGRDTAGAGTVEEITVAAAKTMLAINFTDLIGSATDGQIPNTIEIDLAAVATVANALNADGLNAMSEIAAGIKRGPDATDTHLLTTAESAPGSNTCLEMDTAGSVVLAAAACGTTAVTAVGPGCTSGSCLQDGVTTSGTVMFVWEGTANDANQWQLNVPANPTAVASLTIPDATAAITMPSGTETLATLGGTETLVAKTLTDPTIASFTNAAHDHADAAGGAALGDDAVNGIGDIAAAVKLGPDATDTHILTTDISIPGTPTCLEMDDDGSIILAGGACGAASGDVSQVGDGCLDGACWTDGKVTTGTELLAWEGTTDDTEEFRIVVPLDPGADILWTVPDTAASVTFPTGTVTIATIGGTETLTAKTLTTPTIGDFQNSAHDHEDAAGGAALDVAAIGTGVLPVARGGTAVALSTGTIAVVLSDNPTFNDITLGTTGVSIVDDGDGAITFTGLSTGFDEELTWNYDDVDTVVGVSSGGGTTTIDFGTIDLVTTGIIRGSMNIVTLTGSATATINSVHIVTAPATVTLPDDCDSVTGSWVFVLVRDAAEQVSIAFTDVTDRIIYKGLALSADEELDSPLAALDSVALVCMEANIWYATANSGDWTEETP